MPTVTDVQTWQATYRRRPISPEEIDYYVERGRRLRAEFLASLFRRAPTREPGDAYFPPVNATPAHS